MEEEHGELMSEPRISIERVRQPLTAILGRLDLAKDGLEADILPENTLSDVHAAMAAALDLKRMCAAVEKQARDAKIVVLDDGQMHGYTVEDQIAHSRLLLGEWDGRVTAYQTCRLTTTRSRVTGFVAWTLSTTASAVIVSPM